MFRVGVSRMIRSIGGEHVYKSGAPGFIAVKCSALDKHRFIMKLLIVSCLIAGVLAAPQNYYQGQPYQQQQYSSNYVPIVSETNELNPDGSYSYSYQTGDGQQAQAQGYLKNAGVKDAEAEVAQGSFSYTAPDGTPISVSWVADENGFRAEGAHLPTPPPIPEAIQKSLALIAQTQKVAPEPQYQYQQPQYQQPQYQQPQYQQPQYQPQYQQQYKPQTFKPFTRF